MNKKEYGEIKVKKDCFAYKNTRGMESCKALRCLYCAQEKCNFYKTKAEYDAGIEEYGLRGYETP